MNTKLSQVIVSLFVALVSISVSAQTAPDAERVQAPTPGELPKGLLAYFDSVPTRAQLDALSPDIRTMLESAANAESRSTLERRRAMGLLAHYPDARTRAFFLSMTNHSDVEIRREAFYRLARTFGSAPDAKLVEQVAAGLDDDSAQVREWATRGLRWIAHEDARTVLRQVVGGDDENLAGIAKRALRKHALTRVESVQ